MSEKSIHDMTPEELDERWMCRFTTSNGERVEEVMEDVFVADMLEDEQVFLLHAKDSSGNLVYGVFLNCNDIFAWACADAEPISVKNIKGLVQEVIKDVKNGSIYWACKQRNEKPQYAVAQSMRQKGTWTEEMEALPPNGYDIRSAELARKRREEQEVGGAT